MSPILSPTWCDELTQRFAGLPTGAGGSGTVELVVTGGDVDRTVSTWVVEDGRPTSVTVGSAPEPEVSVPLSRAAADRVLAGEVDPAEAYMRGDLKPEGSSRAWFAWLSAMARDDVRAALAG